MGLNKKVDYSLILLILIYPLLFFWQGLDFTDTGYNATNVMLFLSDDNTIVASSSLLWLTNFVGAGFYYVFDGFGLISLKFLYILMLYISLFFIYKILKNLFPNTNVLIGMIVGLISTYHFGHIYDYNVISNTLFVISSYFLFFFFKYDKMQFLFLGAFVLSLSIFARFPNVLGLAFYIITIYYSIEKKSWKVLLNTTSIFVLGYLSGILFIISIMTFFGHEQYYFDSVREIFNVFTNSNKPYSSVNLLNILLTDYTRVFKNIIYIVLYTVGLLIALLLLRKVPLEKNYGTVVFTATLSVMTYFLVQPILINYEYYFRDLVYMIEALLILLYAYVFVRYNKNKKLIVVALLSLLVLTIVPLGSYNGMYNAIYAFPFPLSFFVSYLLTSSFKNAKIKRFTLLLPSEVYILKLVIIGGLIIIPFYKSFYFVYRDVDDRTKLTYPLTNLRLQGVYTTKERAKVVNEMLISLNSFIKKNDYLLAYESVPLIYFITETKPYLGTSWPILYDYDKFVDTLKNAKTKIDVLPVIVRAKYNTREKQWPEIKKVYDIDKLRKIRVLMNKFIKENNYEKKFENDFFQIYKVAK